jgi:hypothetical protein
MKVDDPLLSGRLQANQRFVSTLAESHVSGMLCQILGEGCL